MNVVFAAGGTGGHLYPAIALAQEFLRRDPATRVLFIGTTKGLEGKVLAHEGFTLKMVTAKPFMGGGLRRSLQALAALPLGVGQCLGILGESQAQLVVGIGGYTSPPVLLSAWLRRIPRVILEPNAYPGLANRAMGPLAQRVFLAFEAASSGFAANKVRVVGTPIRSSFLAQIAAPSSPSSGPTPVLLVFGGSQGALAINTALVEALPRLKNSGTPMTIVHQTGEADYQRVKAAYEAAGVPAHVVPFIYDMPRELRRADLVVARAGAMTVAELTACGKPAVLVPLPTAIYHHQEHNARAMEAGGGAVVLRQADLSGDSLARTIEGLLRDRAKREAMGRESKKSGRTDAASAVVDDCLALVRSGRA
ncbi:MAG: undecaprenyldiphospho-muramoylpentapeptide beta-N-acetylglucosaminyltransferase [Nitrospira sp.]|nr:MAG: undecaprenyldiphospho-muramoylpentapeptide beta-N-acetylglucosaminyltransferase [Nitrospira sp.]